MSKRKSIELRFSQTRELIEAYDIAGLNSGKACRFINEMAYKLGRKKGISKRQRQFLDSLISEGAPTPKGDPKYIAKIDAALKINGFDNHHILKDFRGKLIRGWGLSEKQQSWCDSILEDAKNILAGNHWTPNKETINRMKLAYEVSVCYSKAYWDSHGGGHKALILVENYLAGESDYIEEIQVLRLFKAVTGKLKEMENPKFEIGAKCYVPIKTETKEGDYKWISSFAVVIEGPKVYQRRISYDVLANGKVFLTSIASKRRTK